MTTMSMNYNYFFFFLIFASASLAFPHRGRIIGGDLAEPGQFPFIVSMNIDSDTYTGHFCGGSILNNKWVLVAAHCVLYFQAEEVTILAGTNLINTGGIEYPAAALFPHENFSMETAENDIGLIKIETEFEFNDLIQSIEIGEVGANDSSTVAGWGATSEEDLYPNELRYLEVSALSTEDCKTLAEGSVWNGVIPRGPGEVCIYRGEGYGVCHGDSGGPMVHDGKLVGVTSYTLSNNFCAEGLPDVYTRTAYYADWIQGIIDAN